MKIVRCVSCGISSCLLLLWSCANVVAPTGGPIDEQPPQVVAEESSPPHRTGFEKQRIVMAFDEWVKLNDVGQQVVVSPPLEYPFDLKLKGKRLWFEFDEREVLRENVTYVINFGEAVQDLTESNAAENLRYVFSTGDRIDSLRLRGFLLDAENDEPVAGGLFMLYRNTADSVVRTQRPYYFARSDEQGRFQIENMAAGTYRGFALIDANNNYRYDQSGEAIGFPEALLTVPEAEGQGPITVRLSTERLPWQLLDQDTDTYGRIALYINQPVDESIRLAGDFADRIRYRELRGDSLILWYDVAEPIDGSLFLRADTSIIDTLHFSTGDRSAYLRTHALRVSAGGVGRKKLTPDGRISLLANYPVAHLDTALVRLYRDSLTEPQAFSWSPDTSAAHKIILLSHPWRENADYRLLVLPGAVTDIYGRSNRDTLQSDYGVDTRSNYGSLQLLVQGADPDMSYILKLESGQQERGRWVIQGDSSYQKRWTLLPPGDYIIRVIEDRLPNGRWDPGDYKLLRQPERQRIHPLEEKVRANWDIEARIDLRRVLDSE